MQNSPLSSSKSVLPPPSHSQWVILSSTRVAAQVGSGKETGRRFTSRMEEPIKIASEGMLEKMGEIPLWTRGYITLSCQWAACRWDTGRRGDVLVFRRHSWRAQGQNASLSAKTTVKWFRKYLCIRTHIFTHTHIYCHTRIEVEKVNMAKKNIFWIWVVNMHMLIIEHFQLVCMYELFHNKKLG